MMRTVQIERRIVHHGKQPDLLPLSENPLEETVALPPGKVSLPHHKLELIGAERKNLASGGMDGGVRTGRRGDPDAGRFLLLLDAGDPQPVPGCPGRISIGEEDVVQDERGTPPPRDLYLQPGTFLAPL